MSSRITYIDEDASFEVGEKRHRIIRTNLRNLIDEKDIQKFGEEIFRYIEGIGENSDSDADYCLSLEGVDFISSLTLGKLMIIDKKLKARVGKGLAITSTIPKIYEVFAITQLNKLFSFYDSVENYKNEKMGPRV